MRLIVRIVGHGFIKSNFKSYLVFIFMDAILKIRPEYSGVVQVGALDDLMTLQMLERKIPADGYFSLLLPINSQKKFTTTIYRLPANKAKY